MFGLESYIARFKDMCSRISLGSSLLMSDEAFRHASRTTCGAAHGLCGAAVTYVTYVSSLLMGFVVRLACLNPKP